MNNELREMELYQMNNLVGLFKSLLGVGTMERRLGAPFPKIYLRRNVVITTSQFSLCVSYSLDYL